MSLLRVEDLRVVYSLRPARWFGERRLVRAVDGVSFEIDRGETLGLVGESGCGKSTLGRAIVGLVESVGGRIEVEGRGVSGLDGKGLLEMRRSAQMIFQDPYGSLNPQWSVGRILGEAFEIHEPRLGNDARRDRVQALLRAVGLEESAAGRFPHEFSGGQRQRIGIARALAVNPKLIVCDEPVSALDVSVQAQIVNLLMDLQGERGLAYLFIAHDLAVVENMSRRILVMYLGRVMELGPAKAVASGALHPYTQALISAVPSLDPESRRTRIVLSGEPPSPIDPPAGCPFHPRCPHAEERCRREKPVLRQRTDGHWVACHLV